MRAVVLTGHGGLDRLEFRHDFPTPVPGPGELLVEVGACGISSIDVSTRIGWPGQLTASSWAEVPVCFPLIQGSAVVGRVAAVGDGVAGQRTGERVLIDPSIRDPSSPMHAQLAEHLGSERNGGLAEFVAVPAINAHRIESQLSDVELATFPWVYDTAEEMLVRSDVAEREVIVVTGAAGGIGTALIQLASIRGARIVAVAEAEQEWRLRELGADAFVARECGDIRGETERLLESRPVDVVADVGGGPHFHELIKLVRRGGRYVAGGVMVGPTSWLDLRDLVCRDIEVIGVTSPTADTFARLVALLEWGKLDPVLAQSFGLAEIREAQEQLLRRNQAGNFVLVP